MELLQDGFAAKYAAAKAAKPTARSIRVGRLKLKGTDPKIDQAIDDALAKAGFQVVELDASLSDKFEQAKKDGTTVASAGAWISDERFQFALGVSARTKSVIRRGPDKLYYGLPHAPWPGGRVAADAAQCFREGGPHRFANPSKNTTGTSAAQLENRHS
jgi:hypothetical protein